MLQTTHHHINPQQLDDVEATRRQLSVSSESEQAASRDHNYPIPYSYVQSFDVCKFQECHKFSIFVIIFSTITRPSKFRGFHDKHVTHTTLPCISCFHQEVYIWQQALSGVSKYITVGAIQNGLKSVVRWRVW